MILSLMNHPVAVVTITKPMISQSPVRLAGIGDA
jgi:hypothetical protein